MDKLIEKVKGFSTKEDFTKHLINNLILNEYFTLINKETGKIYSDIENAKEAAQQTYKKFLWFKLKPAYAISSFTYPHNIAKEQFIQTLSKEKTPFLSELFINCNHHIVYIAIYLKT